MELSLAGLATALIIGLLAGAVTGLTGASGVMVVVPLLSIFLNLSVHQSIGTSLLVDVIASAGALLIYRRYGNVELVGLLMAFGSVLGAQLGATLSAYTPEKGLGGAFGFFLILTGLAIYRSRGVEEALLARLPRLNASSMRGSWKTIIAVGLGLAIGVTAGVFGAGGGMMFLITLILVFNMPLRKAIGTSTLIMMITALSGVLGYMAHGYLRPTYGLTAGIGAIIGSTTTAGLANKASEKTLAKTVGALFITLGLVMLGLKGR